MNVKDENKYIGKRIKRLRKRLGLTQTEFGTYFKLKQGSISDIEGERLKDGIPETFLLAAENLFHVNHVWLRTNKGEMGNVSLPEERQQGPRQETPGTETRTTRDVPLPQRSSENAADRENLHVSRCPSKEDLAEKIDMAAKVLQSDTHYAESLDKNIHSFFSAVIKEQELSEKLKEQDRRITELEDFIHKILVRTDKNPVNFHPAGGTFSRTARKQKRPK